MQDSLTCPQCKYPVKRYRNPALTVDILILIENSMVLIERRNPPFGWALPGGFVDIGESLEQAAQREAREETGLDLKDLQQFSAYSDPQRDPRRHTISMVFSASGVGELQAGDDASSARLFPLDQLPGNLCFDHATIIRDFRRTRFGGQGRHLVPIL